jgi:hypothetical protein
MAAQFRVGDAVANADQHRSRTTMAVAPARLPE